LKKTVTKIESITPLPKLTRTAAYCRVSLGTDHMLRSLAAQISYYNELIQNRRGWEFAGVYADKAKTGTKDTRPEFQRLLVDCRAGLIDLVITKSITRFARNTVTLLETVRELKLLDVDVFFEKENIHSISGDGELMLTILASYAQEEALSVSENIKWRKRSDMKKGKTKPISVFGYDAVGGKLFIKPDEAEVVRMIFAELLGGLGQTAIANKLNGLGITTAGGYKWSSGTIRDILTNPKMCGNLLHQRRFVADPISKKQVYNYGELPMYLIEDTHEGIVSPETFDAVQAELARRGKIGGLNESEGAVFRKKIYCADCGQRFWHTSSGHGAAKCRAWLCGGRDRRTGINCTAMRIPEPSLMAVTAEVLGFAEFDAGVFVERVEKIIARSDRHLTFVFHDGAEVEAEWRRRKTIPYSKIGLEKRAGRNICYSIIGKGNGKVGERRKRKEAERKAQLTDDADS
jgi:DNA invertase Pin-like site-specific DNA recombinase